MKQFLDQNFLLESQTARILFHDFARDMPIIDYHCHLPPDEIASDKKFDNLTRIWLNGDHYKWRAMRANGIPEKFITGDADDMDKFIKWAITVPYTWRNPLYHWTHMELKNPFGISKLLHQGTAGEIWEDTREMLQSNDFSVRNIMRKMNVELVCTTDDPADSLEHHIKTREEGLDIRMLPAWRPDKAMAVDDAGTYNVYLDRLGEVADTEISSFEDLMRVLDRRHDFFHEQGCRLSDHGLETFYAADYTEAEIKAIFKRVRSGKSPATEDILKFKSAMLVHFGIMDHGRGWTQQFHIGAIRNNNSRMFRKLGPDTGYDSIGDFEVGRAMSKFLDRLASEDKLTKTIVYNLNPRDNELIATMLYNFNDGTIAGKMQYGSGWWFLDQPDGMQKQINSLSNMGLLSRFVGMLTDSRSFLSFPRHEYFRRILCNIIGNDIEKGILPNDTGLAGKMVQDISYNNAKSYFGFYD